MVQRRPPTHASLLRFLRITRAQVDKKAWAAWTAGDGEQRICVANASGDTFWHFESAEDAWHQWQASARATLWKRLRVEALADHYMASRGVDRDAWDAWLAQPMRLRFYHLPNHLFETPLPEPPLSADTITLPRGWMAAEARDYAERCRDVFLQLPHILAVPSAIRQRRLEHAEAMEAALTAELSRSPKRSRKRLRL